MHDYRVTSAIISIISTSCIGKAWEYIMCPHIIYMLTVFWYHPLVTIDAIIIIMYFTYCMAQKFGVEFNLTIFTQIVKLISVNTNFCAPESCHMLSFCQINICHILKMQFGGYFIKFYSCNYFQPYDISWYKVSWLSKMYIANGNIKLLWKIIKFLHCNI